MDREPASHPMAPTRGGVGSRRLRGYSWFVFTLAALAGVVLVAAGSPLPSVGTVLALGALIALCLNRLAFFPSEWSATAEAAVLVAAVVGFAGQAELLGPLLVALLCGPLDIVHWRQRTFWRMAYNSGNRMIAALLAAGAFRAVDPGAGRIHFVVGAVAASVVFAAVDLAVFVGFEWLRGEQSVRAAVREDLFIDCLTVPLGLFGALAGALVAEVGWWATVLALAPVPFAPSLVLVHARRVVRPAWWYAIARRSVVLGLPVVVVGAIVVALVASLTTLPDPGVLVGLVVVALVAGLELRVDARAPVSPMVAVLVVAAVVVGGDAAFAGAVVVAVVATGTAWIVQGRGWWWAPLLAAGAAATSALVFDVRPSRAGALVAALVFELVVVARLRRVVWTVPLLGAAIALAYSWEAIGAPGALVFGAGALALAVAAAGCGAPPWASRVVGPFATRRSVGMHRAVVFVTGGLSLGLAVAAVIARSDRAVLVPLAESCAAGVAAMAMVGVRQWRFAPRRRGLDAALLLGASLVILLAYPPVAASGDGWSVVILAVALAVSAAVAWPVARRADGAARSALVPGVEAVPLP